MDPTMLSQTLILKALSKIKKQRRYKITTLKVPVNPKDIILSMGFKYVVDCILPPPV
jgi:hypothetical protein